MYKQIPNWPNYMINEDADIINVRLLRRYKGWVANTGYRMIRLWDGHKSRCFTVHKLMALAFFNFDTTYEMCVNHKDANKLNNHLSNLEIVPEKENRAHAHRLKLYIPAIEAMKKSHFSRRQLKEWQVQVIRNEYKKYIKPFRYFAELFGVDDMTVQNAYKRRTWQELP